MNVMEMQQIKQMERFKKHLFDGLSDPSIVSKYEIQYYNDDGHDDDGHGHDHKEENDDINGTSTDEVLFTNQKEDKEKNDNDKDNDNDINRFHPQMYRLSLYEALDITCNHHHCHCHCHYHHCENENEKEQEHDAIHYPPGNYLSV